MEKSVQSAENVILLDLLVQQRKQSGWTQVQMAEQLQLTQSAYSKLERGELRIDLLQLRNILKVLGVSLVDFVVAFEERIADASASNRRSSSRRRK